MNVQRNRNIDLIRILLCITVVLYHMNLLKGGYLAVCGFFVLSGYFTASSLQKHGTDSILKYCCRRIITIYTPLFVTVCLTVLTVSLLPSFHWISLKPETTSVFLCFNNFYQIAARQDYFARAASSPLTHMWYLSILIQYDLVYPIVYAVGKKLFGKRHAGILSLITFLAGIASFFCFFAHVKNGELMNAYYGTFSRIGALLLGSSLALFHTFHPPVGFRNRKIEKILYLLDLLLLCGLLVLGDTDEKRMIWEMLGVTVLTLCLIRHSLILDEEGEGSLICLLSQYTYAVYLVHYPIIYLLSQSELPVYVNLPLIIALTLLLSALIQNGTDLRKVFQRKRFNTVLCILLILTSAFGFVRYLNTQDHTEEMKELEERLNENERLIEERNRDYQNTLEKEKQEWQKLYEDSANKEEVVKEILKEMPIVGIGDSILLDAVPDLYELFPNGWFDAKISRSLYVGEEILEELIAEGKLGDTVILCLATNGDYIERRNEKLMEIVGDREVFWVDAVGADDPSFNRRFAVFAENYDNLHIVPWEQYSKAHPEWFYVDGIHVVGRGVREFAELIYDTVYDVTLQNFEKQMKEAIAQAEAEEKEYVAFYGNKALINVYSGLSQTPKSSFRAKEDYDFETLYADLQERIAADVLEYKIVFLFDQEAGLKEEDYRKIVGLCQGHRIVICDLNGEVPADPEGVNVIRFHEDLKEHPEFLSPDGIRLSETGNDALVKKIIEILEKE